MSAVKAGVLCLGLSGHNVPRFPEYEKGDRVQMMVTVPDTRGDAYLTFKEFTIRDRRQEGGGYWKYQLADATTDDLYRPDVWFSAADLREIF